jgi:hypothetical protein
VLNVQLWEKKMNFNSTVLRLRISLLSISRSPFVFIFKVRAEGLRRPK